MGLIINILFSLVWAVIIFALQLIAIYFGIGLVIWGLYWAFIESSVGYVALGITIIVILLKAIAHSNNKPTEK